ncbi:hypothetical protein AB1Y20_002599 [Prymnesium parvum]|uniref:SGNH hydrolase-type esterase domain-containing protein n=1 Tax=Prymnesium parvum TaxID=97485 RepID=A0AB34JBI1_PRYPA
MAAWGWGLALLALLALWHALRPTDQPPCHRWSCSTPLLADPAGRWPPPRDDLRAFASAASASARASPLPLSAFDEWERRHAAHVALAARGGARLVFLGDSITEGWQHEGYSPRRRGAPQPEAAAVWRRCFGAWRPLNLGLGGDRAQDLGWRLQHGLLPAALDPDVFVLLVGTNDIGRGEQPHVAVEEVLTLVRQLHAAKPRARLLLVGLLPRGGDVHAGTAEFHRSAWWTAAWNNHFAAIRTINSRLAAFARSRAWAAYVETADDDSPFLARAWQPHGAEGAPSNGTAYIRTELMYDLLHLSPRGYEVLGELLLRELRPMMDGAAMRRHANRSARGEGDDETPRCSGRSCRGPDVDLA